MLRSTHWLLLVTLALGLAACGAKPGPGPEHTSDAGAGGGGAADAGDVHADAGSPDAGGPEDTLPDDALFLDPVHGDASNSGTREAPWPGLEDSVTAGLLATVRDGATLALLEGNHGSPSFEGTHTAPVTIRAAPGARPVLGRLTIKRGSGWHVRGVTVSPAYAPTPYSGTIVSLGEQGEASDLVLEDAVVFTASDADGWSADDWMEANSGVLLGRNGTGLTVRRTHVYNVRFGVSIAAFASTLEGSLVEDFSADGVRVTRDGDSVIDTVIKNAHVSDEDGDDNHDDAIQCFLFNVGTGTVRDVTLRGNVIVSYEGQPKLPNAMQAIGFFDGPLVNFVVENNLAVVDHWHGVSLYDAQASRVVGNATWTRWAADSRMRPWVMLGQKQGLAQGNFVHDNLAYSFDFAADASVDAGDNVRITADAQVAGAEARLTQRIAELDAKWGPLPDGAPRLRP